MFHTFFCMFVVSHNFLKSDRKVSIYSPSVISKSKITPYKTKSLEIQPLIPYTSSITSSLSLTKNKTKICKLPSSLTYKQLTSPAHLFSEMSNLSLIPFSKVTVLIWVALHLLSGLTTLSPRLILSQTFLMQYKARNIVFII